jgi:hypothetical protein
MLIQPRGLTPRSCYVVTDGLNVASGPDLCDVHPPPHTHVHRGLQ